MMRFRQEQTERPTTGGVKDLTKETAFDLCMENSRFRSLRLEIMEPSKRKEHMGRCIHYRAKEINHLEMREQAEILVGSPNHHNAIM